MKHRHLHENVGYTMAAIDDILERGGLEDWIALYRAASSDRVVAQKVAAICRDHYMYGTSSLWAVIVRSQYGTVFE